MRLHGVVRASETSNGIEENNDIALVFDHSFGLFADHLGNLNMALRRFIEGRADDFGPTAGTFHVRDFLGTFVNEQNEKVGFRVVFEDRIGQLLHQNGFASARWRDNEAARAFADWTNQIEHTRRELVGGRFQDESFIGKERR